MNVQHAAADAGMKAMNLLHRAVRVLSFGQMGNEVMGMPAVELHVVGRKSGQARSVMLTSPIHDERRTILVASKGGDDRHPEWYRNLVAHPDVELTIAGTRFAARARTASAEEKAELWPQIVAAYAGYAHYERRTGRDIPVVICERQTPA